MVWARLAYILYVVSSLFTSFEAIGYEVGKNSE